MAEDKGILKATASQIKEALAKYPRVPQKGGKEYLEVKYRLLAFKEHYPDSTFECSLSKFENGHAIVHATVYPNAEEWPQWYASGLAMHVITPIIADAVANAETSALGRALDKLGYGTGASFEEPKDAEGNVVQLAEAPFPVKQPTPISAGRAVVMGVDGNTGSQGQAGAPAQALAATDKQIGAIRALLVGEFEAVDGKPDWPAIGRYTGNIKDRDGRIFISTKQASNVIEYLKERQAMGLAGTGDLTDFQSIANDTMEVPF
jgi:hypothetical protein